MAASYPASVLAWTSRINSQTVQAADPNALAAEIDAIETYVGVNPHVESQARTGATKTFASLSARVSDAMLQNGHPYVEVYRSGAWSVYHSSSGSHVSKIPFNAAKSSWPNYFSAPNVTIKDAGVWYIKGHVVWQYATAGWVQAVLYDGSGQIDRSVFNYSMFPRSGSNSYGERFINQFGHTDVSYFGKLSAGSVISVSAGNYTNRNPLPIVSASLSMYFIRP